MSPFQPAPEPAPSRKPLILSLLGLAALLGWQALALRAHMKSDTRPPAWDQAIHMEIALDYREALKDGRWMDALTLAPKPGMPPFPPLYHLALMYAYDHSDPAAAALAVHWVYLALLCAALFGITYEFRSAPAALGAVVIFSCTPLIQGLYRTQLVDLAVATWSTMAYWALLKSKEFHKWLPSAAFGLICGIGFLHKWSFFSYLFPAAWIAFMALARAGSRWKVCVAGGICLSLCLPWYAVHFPILVPTLFQASADFAVPVWRGGAILNYLRDMAIYLGPLLFVFGIWGLIAPRVDRERDRWWVIPAWFLSAYIFWSIVPNRQIRFLLPGLPPIAVAAVSAALPEIFLVVLAGFQMFLAANYAAGWVGPVGVDLPFVPAITMFHNDPAKAEDWKLKEILGRAQSRHHPEQEIANLTLVANDVYFNGPNFTWMVKQMKLPNIRIRGVNSRLCEFSEFVVLKNGNLGPNGVIEGLPEAAKIIGKKDGWFGKAYEKIGEWPLPDKSAAELYRRRRQKKPPFTQPLDFAFYTSKKFNAKKLSLKFGPWDKKGAAYEWIRFSADEVEVRGLRVLNVKAEMKGVAVTSADEHGRLDHLADVRFLKMGRLVISSLKVEAEDLKRFLPERIKGLALKDLEMDGVLRVSGSVRNIPVSGQAALDLLDSPRRLKITLSGLRALGSPVPAIYLNRMKEFTAQLEPNPETPFFIDLPGLTLKGGALSVP